MRKITTFFLLICLFSEISAQNKDAQLLHYFNEQTQMQGFSRVMSTSAYVISVAAPVAQGVTALATHNDKLFKEALCTTVSLGVTTALTYGLKYTIRRQRPYETYPDYIGNAAVEGSPSFPSGHTSIAFSTATSLSLQYPKWYVIAPSYLWACGVGYSRMNLGVHYPTDVVAGAVLGAGSALLTHWVNNLIWRKYDNKKLIGLQVYESPLSIAYNPL